MGALASAQKQQQNMQNKLNIQMQTVAKVIQKFMNVHQKDKQISGSIKQIVEEILLRQDNSVISSKEEDDISLDAI